MTGPVQNPAALLRGLFDAAVAAADPAGALPGLLPAPPRGRTVVVGAGKASARMAQVLEAHWPGPLDGLVVTAYGHAAACKHIEIVEAAHPVPDAAGEAAARRILALLTDLGPDDLALCLISGGGSALLALPAPGLTLDDKQAVNRALLKSGAPIDAMNAVRRHLSAVKGGRLAAAAHPAALHSLLISDVPGDDPAVIASGPTVPDPSTFADARAILARFGIDPPEAVARHLAEAADETPKPGDPRLARSTLAMVATPMMALEAAASAARDAGVGPVILGDAIEGEARDVAADMAAKARAVGAGDRPCVLLSGGETTVTVRGQGRGGRNGEFSLALALALDGMAGVHALAADTDGIDGVEDNAGCLVAPDTLARARAAGCDPASHLADNDSYSLFAAIDGLVMTGPTLTNVNDFRAILLLPA